MQVKVLQFLLPSGRQKLMHVQLSDELEETHKSMIDAGGRLTAEILTTGEVSVCIESSEYGDFVCQVVANGPDVTRALEEMLWGFDPTAFKEFCDR